MDDPRLAANGRFLNGETPSKLAHFGAVAVGLSILISAICDFRAAGWRSLIRPDVLAILALYFSRSLIVPVGADIAEEYASRRDQVFQKFRQDAEAALSS